MLSSSLIKIVGICGGSGSGKTTVVKRISQMVESFSLLPEDSYYKDTDLKTPEERSILKYNFDHPDQMDNDLLLEHLQMLKKGMSVQVPIYDFVTSHRLKETIPVKSAPVIVLEGIFIFFDKRIRDLIDLKLYIDTPSDIRFIRRLKRDIEERGRTLESVIDQYLNAVRPGHFQFIEPMKHYADMIIPEGGCNEKAMQVLSIFLNDLLKNA